MADESSIWIIEFRTRNKLATHWQLERWHFASEKEAQEAIKFRNSTWKAKEHRAVEYRRISHRIEEEQS